MLIIMDGWGLGKIPSSDAIQHANVPFIKSLYNKYPNTTLVTFGEAVGLPDGQMGNSEVGHLNLGAGRVVYQELQRINVGIRDGSFQKNETLLAAVHLAKNKKKPLHLMGLVSNGGVHSHINHLKAICTVCKEQGLDEVYIHAFTDGRDCDPKSGLGFIKELQAHINDSSAKIATVSGRYYAMDRDKRWERIKLAYDAMVNGTGHKATDAIQAIENAYAENITDEFILPTVVINEAQQPLATITNGDVLLSFNFRTDRPREISQALTQMDLQEFNMHKLDVDFTTMTEYDATYKNVHVIYNADNLNNTIGEVIAAHGGRQIRIAETEKYPHVTFFFSGGREVPFTNESRIMVPSPKVATYDMQPEMSAYGITEKLLPEIENETADFICLNFANTDMVGHTGVFTAAVKAAETVNNCVEKIVNLATQHGYTIFLTADHGNSDYMINEDGSPNTQHSVNLVPLFVIGNNFNKQIKPGKLGDIAPSILTVMGLPVPQQMTGEVLFDL